MHTKRMQSIASLFRNIDSTIDGAIRIMKILDDGIYLFKFKMRCVTVESVFILNYLVFNTKSIDRRCITPIICRLSLQLKVLCSSFHYRKKRATTKIVFTMVLQEPITKKMHWKN